jgi:hypothetical protein
VIMSTQTDRRNPYYHREPIENPDQFFDREEILSDLFEYIRMRQSVSLVGERRIGKTSILYQLINRKVRARYLPEIDSFVFVYVNPDLGIEKPQDFYNTVFRSIENQVSSFAFSEEKEIGYRIAREYFWQLRPLCLVLLLDEFQKFTTNESFSEGFYKFLRAIADAPSREYDVSLVTATPMQLYEICCPELMGSASSAFFSGFKPIFVGSFTDEQFDNFLEKTSSPANVPLLDYRRKISDLAGRFPFFIQIACHCYFRAWTKWGPPLDHAWIRQRFMEESRGHFGFIWNQLDPSEQQLVLKLANGETVNRGPVLKTLQALTRKSYVVDGHLFSSAFATFVLQISKGVLVDEKNHTVWGNGGEVNLTDTEYRLLLVLWKSKGRLCTKDDIAMEVWPTGASDEMLQQVVRRVRSKLGSAGRYIQTVHGRGYKLVD